MNIRANGRRWILVAVLAIVLLPIAGWSAFWFYARMRAASEMDAFLEARTDLPIALKCGSRAIGGYPFDIVLTCRDATVTIAGDAGPVTLRLPRLTMTTRLTDARDQTVDLDGPLTAGDARSQAQVRWTAMSIGLRGEVAIADSVLLRGENLAMTCEGCPPLFQAASVQSFDILAQRRGDTTDFTYSAGFAGLRTSALSSVTGSDAPATFAASGIITQFELPTSLRFVAETERWRRDGGQIVIDTAVLDQNALHVEVAGRFAIDAAHRPAGQFTFGARNAATLISAFTGSLNPLLQLAIGAALRGLDGATAKGSSDLSVRLPGSIDNGSVTIGPARGIARVSPLY